MYPLFLELPCIVHLLFFYLTGIFPTLHIYTRQQRRVLGLGVEAVAARYWKLSAGEEGLNLRRKGLDPLEEAQRQVTHTHACAHPHNRYSHTHPLNSYSQTQYNIAPTSHLT
jgi:hypothetical protein